jgi:hypothetical protein
MPTETLLSVDEIRRQLWAIQNSDRAERMAKRAPGVGTVAKTANCSARYLNMIALGQHKPNPKLQAKISAALQTIFPRNKN